MLSLSYQFSYSVHQHLPRAQWVTLLVYVMWFLFSPKREKDEQHGYCYSMFYRHLCPYMYVHANNIFIYKYVCCWILCFYNAGEMCLPLDAGVRSCSVCVCACVCWLGVSSKTRGEDKGMKYLLYSPLNLLQMLSTTDDHDPQRVVFHRNQITYCGCHFQTF